MAAASTRTKVQEGCLWWVGGENGMKGTHELWPQKSCIHIPFGIFLSFIHELLTILFSKSVYPNDLC